MTDFVFFRTKKLDRELRPKVAVWIWVPNNGSHEAGLRKVISGEPVFWGSVCRGG